jgi:hypothetical protein
MIDQDIQIIERIKLYANVNNLGIEGSLKDNQAFLGKLFGIDRRRISALYGSYYDTTGKKKKCKKAFINFETLSTLQEKVQKLKGNDKKLMNELAVTLFSERYEKIHRITLRECILKQQKDDVRLLHAESKDNMFVCVKSEIALENLLNYFYEQDQNIGLDFVLSETLCSNKFEILKRIIDSVIKNQIQKHGSYNKEINFTYYMSKKPLLLNMIGSIMLNENELQGFVYDEEYCYELSNWGGKFILDEYKKESNLNWVGTSQFLNSMLDID